MEQRLIDTATVVSRPWNFLAEGRGQSAKQDGALPERRPVFALTEAHRAQQVAR
jgi:hypothetical protein